ncbi:MAG: UvrB/UvrC motif-containing protein [Pirellulaceae bacterium]|nr:UvrB/UvrC motif-containing protein [Pirellulaceae bacterium]
MKCQKCEKPATFHITELTGPKLQEVHLCEECAREYLSEPEASVAAPPTLAGMLAQQLKGGQLKVGQTAEELARIDQRSCPVCGITFYEFRQAGRLGCPHDYVCFERELDPLIANIHGDTAHVGKHPRRGQKGTDRRTELIRLRRRMKEAVEQEKYELASELRDQIRQVEQQES